MKMKSLTIAALLAVAAAHSASAQTVINITGATAFRKAVIDAITNTYSPGYTFATNAASGAANTLGAVTFSGTFGTIPGTTTIRCSWNGSVEGIRAITQPGATWNAKYVVSTGTSNGTYSSSSTTQAAADFAFSDVLQSSTPELSPALNGGPVGVVVFSLIANKGSSLTGITASQFKDLFKNGYTKKYLLNGSTTDTTSRVFAVGRNDGSGTRTTYLACTGFGVTNLVKQYAVKSSTSNSITSLQLVPADGGAMEGSTVATPAYASTIWGNNADGNGGYASGGTMIGAFTKTTSSVQILDEFGSQAFAAAPIDIVTWVAAGDVASNIANVTPLSYNGVLITPQSSGNILTTADKAKVTQGLYEAWGTENLYYRGTIGTDAGDYKTFYDTLVTKLADSTIVDASGITLGDMKVQRSPTDGGVIAPKSR